MYLERYYFEIFEYFIKVNVELDISSLVKFGRCNNGVIYVDIE